MFLKLTAFSSRMSTPSSMVGLQYSTGSFASANRCSRIIVQDTSTNLLADAYIQPYAPSPIKRRYNTNATCSMTFANQSYNTVAIYADSLLIGTVGKRGNKRVKSFTVRAGDELTFKNQDNLVVSSTLGVSYTAVCPTPPIAQF